MQRFFFYFISLVFFLTTSVYSNSQIVYLDLDKILTNSIAGKSITIKLNDLNKRNLDKFENISKNLKEEESKLIAQKKIMSEEDFKKKVIKLKNKIEEFNEVSKKSTIELNNKKVNATNQLLELLNPILIDYSKKNGISIILNKRNILTGKKELDITKTILKIFDKKIKQIDLK